MSTKSLDPYLKNGHTEAPHKLLDAVHLEQHVKEAGDELAEGL